MNLIKMLVLANVLNPAVSLEAILDALGVIEATENGERRGLTTEMSDPQDSVARSTRLAIWS